MSNASTGERACEQARRRSNEYLDNELAPAAAQEVSRHIARCAACAREMEGAKLLRARLKHAVTTETVPPFLAARIRSRLTERRSSSIWGLRFTPVAATALVCLVAAIAYQLGHLRLTIASQESYIASVSSRVATIMRAGLRDHIHCAVFRKYPRNPPRIEELSKEMGPEYSELIPVVRAHVPGDYQLMKAHQCRYHGRRFVHLALKSDSRLLSLVIARKQEGESFEIEAAAPALVSSGVAFYGAHVQRFQIAAFNSRDYLIYLVSDLPQQINMELMLALAPDVRECLRKLEL